MKPLLIWIGTACAAVALFAANADKVLTIGVKWLGPVLAPYINPQAHIAIRLDDEAAEVADVFAADPANETHPLAAARMRHGQEAVLTLPAKVLYRIGWQGPNIEAGGVSGVLAVEGASSFHLVRAGQGDGVAKVTLRQVDAETKPYVDAQPSAKLLISASASTNAAPTIGSGALPELDRAVAVVGLFETGTTDCARRLGYAPAFGAPPRDGAKVPVVGCVGLSIPGWLGDVVVSLDGGEAHRLDALLGDDADALRALAKDMHATPPPAQMQRVAEHLVAAPEFWIAYQSRVLTGYAQATDMARQIGLVSERGRLLIFDQLVLRGPGAPTRAIRSYAERYPANAADRPADENSRIRALGDILKAQSTIPAGLSRTVARRIDTIVSGQGSIRGISFNFDQLGISTSG